jgi:putative membrane protein
VLFLPLLLTGCSSDDSIEQAAKQSAAQFEAAGIQDMENDALFIAEAASAAMLQLRLSEAATDKAVSPEAKKLAQQMQQEHQLLFTDLQNMVNQSMFVLPQNLGNAHQKIYDEVSERSGIGFDLAYVKQVNRLHDNLLDRYSDMADNGNNMEVKMFASKQLPLIREHKELAEKISDKIEDAR